MPFIPKPQEIYRHFKGNLYQITAIAEHTETGELMVVYQALYGDFRTYARPLAMFTEVLDRDKYPDAGQEFRFELQGPDGARQREACRDGGQPSPSPGGQVAGRQACGQAAGAGPVPAGAPEAGGSFAGEGQEENALDPMVLEFLDAGSYGQRLNILAGIHHRITDDMITTMAIACDVEINDGEVEERYEALKLCLMTLERYECNRLR